MDDWQLLKCYGRDDSQDAFTEIVRRHLNLVFSTALRRVGEAELAKDVTQLVFANLARRAKSLKPKGTLAGWLHRDACFTALDVLRRERRRVAREQEAVAMQDSEAETPDDWQRIKPGLDAALRQLGQTDRDAVLLRFFEQRTLKDVGSALGMEEDATRKRVARALEKLRALLARQGITTTTAALSVALTTHAVQAAPAGLAAGVVATSLSAASTAMAGATAVKFVELLGMTKLKATLATAVLVAGLGTPLFLQHEANKSLTAQNAALLAQVQPMAGIPAQNETGPNRIGRAADSLSDEQKLELVRLRNEAAKLRTDAIQTEKLRQEINRLRAGQGQPAAQSNRYPRESWAFAGYVTPDAAIQSLAWAGLQGDLFTFVNSMTHDKQQAEQGRWQKQGWTGTQIRDELAKEFGQAKAIHIQGRQAISEGQVVLSVLIEREDGRSEKAKMRLEQHGHEWKIGLPLAEDEHEDLEEE